MSWPCSDNKEERMPAAQYSILRAITRANPSHTAVRDAHGAYSYAEMLARSRAVAAQLTRNGPLVSPDSRQPRIGVLTRKDHTWVESMLAAWHLGAIAVPLAEAYPASELEYVLKATGASAVVAGPSLMATVAGPAANLNINVLEHKPAPPGAPIPSHESLPSLEGRTDADGAYIIFTSGTTGTYVHG